MSHQQHTRLSGFPCERRNIAVVPRPDHRHADTGQSIRLHSELALSSPKGQACPRVVINEVVTDPQQDWNDPSTGSEPALRGRH